MKFSSANYHTCVLVHTRQSSHYISLDCFLTFHVTASTPMLLQLSPLIAVALGAVGSVILLVLAVVAALRLRRRHEKKPGDSTKHSSESNDSVEKNPDIIPLSNGMSQSNCSLEVKCNRVLSSPNFASNKVVVHLILLQLYN